MTLIVSKAAAPQFRRRGRGLNTSLGSMPAACRWASRQVLGQHRAAGLVVIGGARHGCQQAVIQLREAALQNGGHVAVADADEHPPAEPPKHHDDDRGGDQRQNRHSGGPRRLKQPIHGQHRPKCQPQHGHRGGAAFEPDVAPDATSHLPEQCDNRRRKLGTFVRIVSCHNFQNHRVVLHNPLLEGLAGASTESLIHRALSGPAGCRKGFAAALHCTAISRNAIATPFLHPGMPPQPSNSTPAGAAFVLATRRTTSRRGRS